MEDCIFLVVEKYLTCGYFGFNVVVRMERCPTETISLEVSNNQGSKAHRETATREGDVDRAKSSKARFFVGKEGQLTIGQDWNVERSDDGKMDEGDSST